MLLKGDVEGQAGRWAERVKSLESLMTVKGVKIGQEAAIRGSGMFQFGEDMRCQAYLALAKAYAKVNRT